MAALEMFRRVVWRMVWAEGGEVLKAGYESKRRLSATHTEATLSELTGMVGEKKK